MTIYVLSLYEIKIGILPAVKAFFSSLWENNNSKKRFTWLDRAKPLIANDAMKCCKQISLWFAHLEESFQLGQLLDDRILF